MEDPRFEILLLKLAEIGRALDQLPANLFPQMVKAGQEILSQSRIFERLASLEALVNLQNSIRTTGGR